MRHFGVQVQAEDEEQDACDNEGTAADKLKEVDAGTRRAHHYGLNKDERDESQDLQQRGENRLFENNTTSICPSSKQPPSFYRAENQSQHLMLT